jgi:AraC-like DNA-binding protein
MPASYLYIRNIITDSKISKLDLFHLIPALIYIVDYFPFFFVSAAEKIAFMQSKELSKMVLYYYESRFFVPGFYIIFKYILAFFYWISQLLLLMRVFRIKNPEFRNENSVWLRWLTIFVLSQIFLFLPMFKILKAGYGDDELTVFLFIGGFTGLTSIFLFVFPQILYGIKGVILTGTENNLITSDPKIQNEKTAQRYLSKDKMDEIVVAINDHLNEKRSFLDKQYSMTKLANELNLPPQYVSAVINERENMNFNDYINNLRIQYCIELLNRNGHKHYKLESVADKCGFNNRNTFTIAFKKVTGKTPMKYIKDILS